MGPNKPNNNDIQKLHAEVNQIVNQRLGLTTLAITIFGVIIAWLIPREVPTASKCIGSFTYAISVLLTLILFALFQLTHHLSSMLRIITTYLDESGASTWEKDWAIFRKKFSYLGYTKPQSIIFLILGTISAGFPYLLWATYSFDFEPRPGILICTIIGFIYIVLVSGMGFLGWFAKENQIRRKWKELRDEE